ncbi:EthD family reductase [Halomarina oriensis]|uniref:EthD family reductase n=1 Tax=Halomarina oriensis TaxID=671145 RepID=A0A6B0GFG6_9EURY|nr:EthD family reductase [Halomarina oriensis]MWG33444.1 EthD family reductase [Halomarina oriensis]
MYTLYALWTAPDDDDVEAFEEHYTETHAPLAAAVPNLNKLVTVRATEGLEEGDPAYYRVAEMEFDSREDLHEAEASDEWAKVREDSGKIIEEFGVSLEVAIGEKHVTDGDS